MFVFVCVCVCVCVGGGGACVRAGADLGGVFVPAQACNCKALYPDPKKLFSNIIVHAAEMQSPKKDTVHRWLHCYRSVVFKSFSICAVLFACGS